MGMLAFVLKAFPGGFPAECLLTAEMGNTTIRLLVAFKQSSSFVQAGG